MKFTSIQIARVWGIPIRLHVSILLMIAILAAQMDLKWAIMLEAGLGLSIILHELGHCAVALHMGCRVREITLYVIGGAAHMERIPRDPRDECLMAVAGPAVSFALALLFWFLDNAIPLPAMPNTGGQVSLLTVMAILNLALVVFNMLPAFPMDGGRVLRAALTRRFGRLRATAIAARLGMFFASLFVLWGISSPAIVLTGNHWSFEARALIHAAIGFFVFIAADGEYTTVRLQEGDLGIDDSRSFLYRQRKQYLARRQLLAQHKEGSPHEQDSVDR